MTGDDQHQVQRKAALLIDRAESFASKRDWSSADRTFQEALRLDPSCRNRIAYGVTLAKQERYFEAISMLTPILDQHDLTAIGIVCHNLAAIYRDVGDLDLARRFQWRATLLHDDVDVEGVLALANDALASDRVHAADALVTMATEMTNRVDDPTFDADLVATAGLVKSATEPTQGLLLLFAAYQQHREDGDWRGMGLDQSNMALLLGQLGRVRSERKCLIRAIRCFDAASAHLQSERVRKRLERLDSAKTIRSFDVRRN